MATLLLNLRHGRYANTIHHHHHHFENSIPISSLTTSNVMNPIQRIRFSDGCLIEPHHLSRAMQAFADARDRRAAGSLHTHLIKLHSHCSISLWNKMLNMYCQCGHIRCSRQVFEGMPQRDVISFNTMISAYVRQEQNTVEALHLYSRMREENVKPNHITLSALLGARGSVEARDLLEQIHTHVVKRGSNSNEFVGSSLIDGYSKCMRLEGAIRAFDEIKELDLISWNVMIDACVRNGSEEHALRIFDRMRQEGVGFDCFTLTSVIKTCTEPRDLGRGMQIHGCVLKAGLASETPVGNALMTMYSKCEEGMKSAAGVFRRIQAPNIISWTAMIAGSTQNGLNKKAIRLYREMLRQGLKENEFTFASILPAYASLASLEQGKQVHARIVRSKCGLDVSVGNALIDMYFKCGSSADAELAFTTMENRDVVSWTVMIAGYGQHGMGSEALEIFEAMRSKGIKPDGITFLGSLSACSHCGLVDEGLRIFRLMIDVYGIKPKKEHYACVVDMLGRAGRLKEAERFIEDMGIGSDASSWEALLGACTIHGEIELGERSAEKIMELEPEKNGPYVLLSNIYAEKGMWEEKRKVRGRLDASGLRKEAGHSWVAVQGHSCGSLDDEVETAGYIPTTQSM
ncbi:pentatricopeptide repeat-containing protein At1g11290, chloroplastic-like [Magnolia sinica]|uniref:pentatricopeptide repeat-containing protein At1g11290, chloroplastic-like n=1 Tax=Magnolia sinica TaxID=86752 RepID=UPI002659EFC6|nr:pentatricopeptide repeat-containing protein At1g11290, chloroplastic-like [Magnolia sinica]